MTFDALQESLASLRETCSRPDYIRKRTGRIRAFLAGSTEDIRVCHRSGASGREIVKAFSDRADGLIQLLYDEAVTDAGCPPPRGFAVLAQGGYGRGELNPKSDIDLLFLFTRSRRDDPITRIILHVLWDLHFDVGHSTRTISECLAAARESTDTLTAMIEARFLVGDRRLAVRLEKALARDFSGRKARAYVVHKTQERRHRHARAGMSVQLLEPNVKESPGGLRDAHTAAWLLKIRRGRNAPDGLLRERLLTRRSYRIYIEALDFLLRTRSELHFSTGRRYDVLEHDLQPTIARGLNYEDDGHVLGVEGFMRDYYLHARNIKHLSDLICERFESRTLGPTRGRGSQKRRILSDDTVLSNGRVGLPRRRRDFFSQDPCRLLNLFRDAQRFGAQIGETAQRAIKDNLHLIDGDFRASARAAEIFLDILRAPGRIASTLRAMHDLGVLGAYIPEFGSITCLVQYNRYHIYTADEHTLVAIENLEQLGSDLGGGENLNHLKAVYHEIPEKEWLYLALLAHDVGKSVRELEHSVAGAEMVRSFVERLGVAGERADSVVFLVQHHLAMSHIAQRRDLSDGTMLGGFSDQVGDRDILRKLYLLTYADLSAVTRTAWTAWKAQLLEELYVKAQRHLTSADGPLADREDHEDTVRGIVTALEDRFDRAILGAHFRRLPRRYAETSRTKDVATHLRLAERLNNAPVALAVIQNGPFSELTLSTRDKPYRLSEICGVLATSDINIFSAQAYTRTDGVVIDTFQVTDIDGSPEIDAHRQGRIERLLSEVFEGAASVDDLFAGHKLRWSRRRNPAIRIPTEVHFENGVSDRYTVIDVFAQDAVGLLYRITRALSDLGLDIDTARINTQADKAVDSFYVTLDGRKIEAPRDLERIRQELAVRIG